MKSNNNDNSNIDIQGFNAPLDIRNNYVLTDIFNKHFDEEKHVPLLYLVLDINTLDNDTEPVSGPRLLDVKLLMLEVEKNVDKKTKCLKRHYLNETLKMNINNLIGYTECM